MFPQEPNVPEISAEEVKKLMGSKEAFTLLDVRTEGEYARGKIEGSINLPLDQVPEKVEATLPDKDVRIVVYCLSGSRSVFAVEMMQQMGYTNVVNMTSGLLAWRATPQS
jgi:rhodanese-related sulfurtransferase